MSPEGGLFLSNQAGWGQKPLPERWLWVQKGWGKCSASVSHLYKRDDSPACLRGFSKEIYEKCLVTVTCKFFCH